MAAANALPSVETEMGNEKTEHIDEDLNDIANQEEHELGAFATIRKRPKLFAWCLWSVFTCLGVSFENQAAGIVLSIPEFRKDFGYLYEGEYQLHTNWQSAFYGGPLAATIIGTLAGAVVADKLGRQIMLGSFLLVSFAAVALEYTATTNAWFFGGKLVNGVATGVLWSVAMSYIGEITPLALRGFFTCFNALMFTIGPLIAAIIVNYTGGDTTRWAYRAVFVSQFAFSALAVIFVPFMPESPVWLISVGKRDRAIKSLRRLGYSEAEVPPKIAQLEFTLEQAKKESEGATYLECFRKSNVRRTIISFMPMVIQALCGVYWTASYTAYYIQLAGFSDATSFKLQIVQNGLAMAGNICSWFLVDRVGRRSLTMWGTFSLVIILALCAGLAVKGTTPALKGSIAFLLVYNFFYNITIGSTAFTLLVEVATSRLRVKTISIGIAAQYIIYTIWAFVLPLLFNPSEANLGAKTAFIFAGFGVLCWVYLYFYQVETAGRSYEELDEMFAKGVSTKEFKSYVTDAQLRIQRASTKEVVEEVN